MSFVQRQVAHCDQCGHEWLVVAAKTPTHCAKCRSRKWNTGPVAIERKLFIRTSGEIIDYTDWPEVEIQPEPAPNWRTYGNSEGKREVSVRGNVVEEVSRVGNGSRPISDLVPAPRIDPSPMATKSVAVDMQALRDICAGNLGITDRAAFDSGWDRGKAKSEVPICGKDWWEDGEHYECLMDAGHKEQKHGMRGMVRVIS